MLDVTKETLKHIARVNELCQFCAKDIQHRGQTHDTSKLKEPEKTVFESVTHKLKTLTYGSDEYKETLKELGPALDHHYQSNDHHPEHFEHGFDDMNLLQLIELCVDWKAAQERHADSSIERTLEINKERFHMSDQLVSIIKNTLTLFG
jgi:hypothetical protein